MKILAQGVHKFQQEVFGTYRELFAKLASSQKPHTLFITCSDSRINPNMLTQTDPGEIFILRNAGNIIPVYEDSCSGESATIEFAVKGLGVDHIVVCGHSNCGAMSACLNPELTRELPALKKWLSRTEEIGKILNEYYSDCGKEESLNIAIQENVLLQLENLRTHPSVAERMDAGKLHIHGWVYKIPTGEVFAYDPKRGQFYPLSENRHEALKTRDVVRGI